MSGGMIDADDRSRADDPITFSPLDGTPGLRIADKIERRRYSLATPTTVTPTPVDPDRLGVPVDAAVEITASEVTLPQRESVYVRDESGTTVRHAFDTPASCAQDRYLIDVTTPVKLYLRVDAPVTVTPSAQSTTIAFGGATPVVIGARSPHRRPSGRITTTRDEDDLRVAVSALSSTLKTTSPERTFPTLRGHPPLLEFDDHRSVPTHLSPPESGITIEVRRSVADLLVVAPLAFFLGADLTWGDRRLVTDTGVDHPLSASTDFETGVERTLKRTFLLDCLARTEGLYPIDLHERRVFDERTDGTLDFARLYRQPLSRRLDTYLRVPYETVADLVPAWSCSAYVQPDPGSVTSLPYLLDTLSTVRTSGPQRLEEVQNRSRPATTAGPGTYRSVGTADPPDDGRPHLVLPEPDSAVTNAWVGEGIPIGAVKPLASGFDHRLARKPTPGDIHIQVVCNEPEMLDERDSARDVYLDRRDPAIEVDIHTDVSTDDLLAILEREADFFHFIGHIDRRGFRCRDGWFTAEACDVVGADVFLLNSCRSYEQGERLVRKGAVGGIVTITDLLNHRATAIGRTMAQFMNYGFPLYAALDVVSDTYRFGDAYVLLGDAHTVLSQPTTTIPEFVEVRSRTEDAAIVEHRTFPSHWAGVGTHICPSHEDGDRHYLLGGEIATFEMPTQELETLLSLPMPLRDGGDLRFSLGDGA